MRIICGKLELLEAINIVQKAVSTKTTQPLLEGILFEATDKLKLTGNNQEIGIECFVDADIRNEGAIVISSKTIGDIIRKMPVADVSIEIKEQDNIIVECENSYFKIKGLNAEGFPVIPSIEKKSAIKINEKMLRDMIKQTIFAASVEENKTLFSGILIESINNCLSLVALDTSIMALRKNESINDFEEFSAIIPQKTLNELSKILINDDSEVNIQCSNNQVLFEMNNCKLISKLIEGTFFKYNSLIPSEYMTRIKIKTKELLYSIERASLLSIEEKKQPVIVNIKNDLLLMRSNSNIGNVREEIFIEVYGSNIEIGFNPKYFIDILKVIDDEEIFLNFTSEVGPCIIKPVEKDNFTYMILPVRIKE